jgi:hypothetical protein
MLRSAAAKEKMSTPATASAVMHASVLVVAFFGLPDLFNRPPPIEPEPVMVEFQAIDKKAAAPTVGNPPPQPKDAPVAQETTKAPPPKTAEPPPVQQQPKQPEQVAVAPALPPKPEPVPVVAPPPPPPVETKKPDPPKPPDEVALKPKQPEPPKVEKQPDPPKPPPPPPPPPQEVKKPDPPKPPPPQQRPPPPKTADSLVDDILKNKNSPNTVQTPEQQPKPPQQVTRQPTAAPQLSAVVTASEIEGVRAKIRPCWNTLGAAKEAPIVTFVVQMQQDGTPSKVEVRDTGRYNNDPVYRAAADSAWRALMNPRCQPWPLSPEKYATGWRYITFNFDPRDY